MPLARIVTRFPESSLAASEFLRSRGYTVEVVDPGDFRVTPAVVELKLGKCAPDEALLRAQEAVGDFEAHKSEQRTLTTETTSPDDAPIPIAYDITGRAVEFAERRRAPNSFRGALLSLLRRAWDDTGSRLPDAVKALGLSGSKTSETDAQPPVKGRVIEAPIQVVSSRAALEADNQARADAEREAAEREQRARIAAREAEERERVRLQRESEAAAERERQRAAAAAREAELSRQREQERVAAQRAAAAAREAELSRQREQERVAAQRAAEERARLPREAEAAAERERERIAAARAAELAHRREQQNSMSQRAAEERARRVREAELSLERERLRIEAMRDVEFTEKPEQEQEQPLATQRSTEEEANMRAAGELTIRREREKMLAQRALLEAQRQRLFAAAQEAYEKSKRTRGYEALLPAPPRPEPVEPHYRRRKWDLPSPALEQRLNPVREAEWKKAFAAAGAVAVLVTAGIVAFANRRPAEPLSPEEINRSQAIEQQTPFGGATINPAPAAVPQPAKPAPVVVPTIQKPAPTHPVVNKTAAAPRRPTSNVTGGRLRRDAPEEYQVAEDQVVVRHFDKPHSVLKSAVRGDGIKQISDLQ